MNDIPNVIPLGPNGPGYNPNQTRQGTPGYSQGQQARPQYQRPPMQGQRPPMQQNPVRRQAPRPQPYETPQTWTGQPQTQSRPQTQPRGAVNFQDYTGEYGIVAYDGTTFTLLEHGKYENMLADQDLFTGLAPSGTNVVTVSLSGLDIERLKSDALYANEALENCVYR